MKSPAVVSIWTINGGSRGNIVADSVVMTGTIRTYDQGVRKGIHRDIKQIAENIADSADAKAEVDIIEMYEPTVNDERVTARMVPVLERAADGDAILSELSGAADDVSVLLAQGARALFQPRYRAAQSRHYQSRAEPQPRIFHRRERARRRRARACDGDGELSGHRED